MDEEKAAGIVIKKKSLWEVFNYAKDDINQPELHCQYLQASGL